MNSESIVTKMLDIQGMKEIKVNRQRLKPIIESFVFLVCQNIALEAIKMMVNSFPTLFP